MFVPYLLKLTKRKKNKNKLIQNYGTDCCFTHLHSGVRCRATEARGAEGGMDQRGPSGTRGPAAAVAQAASVPSVRRRGPHASLVSPSRDSAAGGSSRRVVASARWAATASSPTDHPERDAGSEAAPWRARRRRRCTASVPNLPPTNANHDADHSAAHGLIRVSASSASFGAVPQGHHLDVRCVRHRHVEVHVCELTWRTTVPQASASRW